MATLDGHLMEPDGQMVTMMDSETTMNLMDLTKNDEPY